MKGSEMVFMMAVIVLSPHISEKAANKLATLLALFGFVVWAGE